MSTPIDARELRHSTRMNTPGGSILIVDDELPIRRLLRMTLKVQDYEVFEAGSVAEAIDMLAHEKIDVMILDLGLPDGDGIEVIHEVRSQSALPIIVLSSRNDERGKVAALDAGADDYVTKPFGVEELMARIRTALRHKVQDQGGQPLYQCDGLVVDLVRRLVTRDSEEVKLSPKEYGILQQLVIHAGKVLTHRHILREVWNSDSDDNVQYLRVYIRQLRGKLERDPEQPLLILTEPGVGYRLKAPTC